MNAKLFVSALSSIVYEMLLRLGEVNLTLPKQHSMCSSVTLSCQSPYFSKVIAMSNTTSKNFSDLCFWLGFLSIIGSIAIWMLTGGESAESKAHAERFGIFVGLWAPTFFALSARLLPMNTVERR